MSHRQIRSHGTFSFASRRGFMMGVGAVFAVRALEALDRMQGWRKPLHCARQRLCRLIELVSVQGCCYFDERDIDFTLSAGAISFSHGFGCGIQGRSDAIAKAIGHYKCRFDSFEPGVVLLLGEPASCDPEDAIKSFGRTVRAFKRFDPWPRSHVVVGIYPASGASFKATLITAQINVGWKAQARLQRKT